MMLNVNIENDSQIYKVIHSKRLQSLGWKWETSFEEGMRESYDFVYQIMKNGNKIN